MKTVIELMKERGLDEDLVCDNEACNASFPFNLKDVTNVESDIYEISYSCPSCGWVNVIIRLNLK